VTDGKPLTRKQLVFVAEYIQHWNATKAAINAGYSEKTAYSIGHENLRKPEIKAAIDAALSELQMSAEEALVRETEIGRVGVGFFFKIVDEWMFNPLPEYEILDQREVIDDTKDPPEKQINYRIRHAVLDMDKVIDPKYAHLIKKFSNSRRTGLSIEMHDGQTVHRDVLKMAGKFTDRVDVTSGGEKIKGYIGFTPEQWDKKDDTDK
jgi:phage terminase small subunit